jgi:hypothetical protein
MRTIIGVQLTKVMNVFGMTVTSVSSTMDDVTIGWDAGTNNIHVRRYGKEMIISPSGWASMTVKEDDES